MAKKYYWLKLQRDFFKRHDIRIIESMPNGKDYILFYLKLLVESIDHEGELRFSETIPYNEEMLSTITNTNVDIVRSAMKVFSQLEMIDIMEDSTIFMSEVQKMIGFETEWAEKKRKYRENLDEKRTLSLECPPNVRQEKEIEKEIELEKDINILSKDNIRSNPADMQRVIDAWNELGLSKVTKITQGTDRYIWLRKRIKDYGIDEVLRAVDNVKHSTFLQNSNFFSFDWMIRPNNFPKVLDGNYTDATKTVSDMYEKAEEQFNYTFNKYPNKNNYDSSKKAWSEIVNGNEKKAIDIYNAVVYYLKSLKNDEIKYVKSMDKWLREDSEYWIMSYKRGDVDD